MTAITRERLFGFEHAFDSPVTLSITIGLGIVLALVPLILLVMTRMGKIEAKQREELWKRYYSWAVIIPLMLVPVLAGALWTMLAVAVLSLLCYREYARATGLFRDKAISLFVVLGILLVTFAVVDHWYDLFVALFPLTVGSIAAVAILADQPKGYIQRVALGVLGFALFGSALGHLGYMANDTHYRPLMLMVLLTVEANDVFAFLSGKTFGRRKLAPNTSPNKTLGGAIGALILTVVLVCLLGHFVFDGNSREAKTATEANEATNRTQVPAAPASAEVVERNARGMAQPFHLIALGIIISVLGQLGDLVLSSIKRDLGLKDMGTTIPGHGGLLDRFDSLILVAPAVFHYVGYFNKTGFGFDQPLRIISGG